MKPTLISTNSDTTAITEYEITSGIDSTYVHYMFVFTGINPSGNGVDIKFNASIDGGSNYNLEKTTTYFKSEHSEDDDDVAALAYDTGYDLHGDTSNQQPLMREIGNGADEIGSGILHLFNPASTSFIKQFYGTFINYNYSSGSIPNVAHHSFPAGYFNTTSAINAVKFVPGSGNIDGTIQMYGIA